MRLVFLLLFAAIYCTPAAAQQNCPATPDVGTSNTTCANTAFVTRSIAPVQGEITTIQGEIASINSAWTTYTPVVTSFGGGTIASYTATGRFKTIGKTVHITTAINIINEGTATAHFAVVTLPPGMSSTDFFIFVGREAAVVGTELAGQLTPTDTSFIVSTATNGGVITTGYFLLISGTFETN